MIGLDSQPFSVIVGLVENFRIPKHIFQFVNLTSNDKIILSDHARVYHKEPGGSSYTITIVVQPELVFQERSDIDFTQPVSHLIHLQLSDQNSEISHP